MPKRKTSPWLQVIHTDQDYSIRSRFSLTQEAVYIPIVSPAWSYKTIPCLWSNGLMTQKQTELSMSKENFCLKFNYFPINQNPFLGFSLWPFALAINTLLLDCRRPGKNLSYFLSRSYNSILQIASWTVPAGTNCLLCQILCYDSPDRQFSGLFLLRI